MTVMERNSNKSLIQETNKLSTNINANNQDLNQNNQSSYYQQYTTSINNGSSSVQNEKNHSIINTSRKNSGTGSINMGSTGIPTSTLSLSSTSSNSSSITTNKNDVSNNTSKFRNESSSSPLTSRRESGNSITIKITNENNIICLNNDLTNQEEDEEDTSRDKYKDRDREEDTTSDSNSNDLTRNHSKKKLKERKKLIRSSAQQQHHLTYQESEDQVEEERMRNIQDLHNELLKEEEFYDYKTNMNSGFDELFAAAESGNLAISAMAEAKMAAVTAAASAEANENLEYDNTDSPFSKRNRGSFRSRSSTKRSQKTPPNDNIDINHSKKSPMNNLKAENYLGSPQQLTRSCSCKRPSSFKKMKTKNGVSPSVSPNRRDSIVNGNANQFPLNMNVPSPATTPAANITGRRGTHCSITISEDIDSVTQQIRAGSLPFENLSQQQPNNSLLNPNDDSEVYRVRQFNITNKGSVINRGDSFKRSFKRSNNSLSSKKDNSPTVNLDGNTLNLPEYFDNYGSNKSGNSSNIGLNELTENKDSTAKKNGSNNIASSANAGSFAQFNTNDNLSINNLKTQESIQTFIIYILGSSSVGKNALIKQFKTSEYRGTYEVNANHSADEDADEGVCVMLDGIESRLQFVSMDIDASTIKPGCASLFELTKDNNAFVLVYSISDKSSFHIASELLKLVRNSENKNQPVILVGNKSDLVRKRCVNREDGKNIALKYGSKFVETSVAINDKVDDLLVGILKQIRIKEGVEKDTQKIFDSNLKSSIETTTFIDNSSKSNFLQVSNKKHTRNFSDIQLQDIVNKSNSNKSLTLSSFKSNTLTRRLFRSKNKENNQIDFNLKNNQNLNKSTLVTSGTNHSTSGSFFHKLFHSIFRKKSEISHLQSVENLFTPPTPSSASFNKLKK